MKNLITLVKPYQVSCKADSKLAYGLYIYCKFLGKTKFHKRHTSKREYKAIGKEISISNEALKFDGQ